MAGNFPAGIKQDMHHFNQYTPEYQRNSALQNVEDYLLGMLVDYDDEERAGMIIRCLKEAGALAANDTIKE